MIKTDVLVIGAGPAGSTAARFAAKGGAKVILMDKKSEIGAPKRCAEGVSKRTFEILELEADPHWITQEIEGIRLIAPDGTDVWLTNDVVELPEAGYILERKVFDKHLAMEAGREGVEIRIKTQAKGLKKEEDGSYTVTCECMGEVYDINAKILIGADGSESHVAKWAGLKAITKPKHMEAGVQFEMCNAKMERNYVLEFYFGSVAPGGYFWLFPKGDDIVNAGLAIIPEMAEKSAYEYLVDAVNNCYALKDAQPVELNVGGDPVGGLVKEMYNDNIMLCGDAASQVNPLTGGGITSGITGGKLAGQTAAEAIAAGDCSKKFLKKYAELVDEAMGHVMDKYSKACDYLWSLDDDDLNSIAHAFRGLEFTTLGTTELVKALIKVQPSAALKLRKLFL
ncbi:NAD(P)/FAD-dependent oxidoreductase [uncultured Methanobrevibacter sp.]|uniref:NAD(P)/FAD-dependent oxidoreductase n=1 Tax=uncultured Methanobrevibacter sp. TaxID=253161 RepID=UPI0025DEF453|nr:NAD(P)/FAD-dependent oxidoreductase [uncultured Methanobrevibacter sp.]